ncbi:hypothetical protein [Pseudoalteromonas luteoviolacea]|uniref:Uncharacterized protein n=1 Tax=Pseudoalteromonas luteoviolacea S4054 TaxID=1129367 RepID=A0A0F6A4Z2_9GAMM|nr:hypothetical protein [Pseudoalteromonas luteoviolacea]AOT07560.1 hypothetical protein S4054249_06775 [Pseudoalteromonas luteoviolacea]AOT12476.1 hypothetical protein S40542_06775 [Pseudoalteromonas luteoviolacea]AOT17390.1 hypothetical protein S4054_06775 [Pseudoalteromonas luteoviolacea]KKE81295.1 hypothetical protein N479_22430 [Pseudoalteromonas luteoviolacea S4054]KZN70696.1 hypothetical protein N481_21005 [Pseudoalteromonas luteoviolacea S4047-1]
MKLKINKKAIKSLSSNAPIQNTQTPKIGGGAGPGANSHLSVLSCGCDSRDITICTYTCY